MSEDIVFPKKWKELSEGEQREWIGTYYMPKTLTPEPILAKRGKIKAGILRLENGARIEFPLKPVIVSRNNPNIVREFEVWVGKWLITVFHDKSLPYARYVGVSNPSKNKWLAQELSSEILTNLLRAILKIGNKYRLFQRNSSKSKKDKRGFSLSLRDNKGENTDG
jgi:hypothetical protein